MSYAKILHYLERGEFMSEFEKQVKIAMIQKEMTMLSVAKQMGVSVSYVCELIKGTRKNETRLSEMKEILGIA